MIEKNMAQIGVFEPLGAMVENDWTQDGMKMNDTSAERPTQGRENEISR